jgi:DNA mismatch repair protein MutL
LRLKRIVSVFIRVHRRLNLRSAIGYDDAMPIRELPLLLVNQIAAGEVIERPASVVKELVENALDAGATRIDVAVEDGGRTLIRVSDDGGGIPPEELPLAIAPHATSKIAAPQDLAAIHTMGFRGEALASIASVSRLRLTSRVPGREAGACIEAAGDHCSAVKPAAIKAGTILEVRDLFFNTPARRKFMRGASTEFGHLSETLQRIAMARPTTAFKLTHNDRVTFDLPAVDSPAQRCLDVLGQELADGLLQFEHHDSTAGGGGGGGASVWGLAGMPALARASAKFQYLFLNGRPIRDRGLGHAIKEAYRGLIAPDRQPVAVVMLTLDPHDVDVNVHPAKAEVRFGDPNRMHGLVLAPLRQRLLGADLTPQAKLMSQGSGSGNRGPGWLQEAGASPLESGGNLSGGSAFVDYFRRMDPQQKRMAFQDVKQALIESDPTAAAQDGLYAHPNSDPSTPNSAPNAANPTVRPTQILQVHSSYVVTQDREGILIVDQHALHERVMFETLRQRVIGEGKTLESQRLLMPATLSAKASRLSALEQLQPLLTKIGIEAAPMGPATIAVHAFPSFLFDRKVEPHGFLEELLDKAEAGELDVSKPTTVEAALHEVLDMMACKAAIKAGDAMSEQELAQLLQRREQIERASNCPHGRPTTLRLTIRDLEKQFGRG